MKKVCIYWTCHREAQDKICKRFGIPNYMSVAGETEATIKDEDLPLFNETKQRGFFITRNKTR